MVTKTALYLRKSREDLTESKEDTLARHEKMLNDYCAGITKRYTCYAIIVDNMAGLH